MAITSTKGPTFAGVTFNNVSFPLVQIFWNLLGTVSAVYTRHWYATDQSGANLSAPGTPVRSTIPDLYALAATRAAAGKPALANALSSVLTALAEIETEKGTI